MTFTIVGRCARTGITGICMATSSPAVGNRCSFVSRDGAVGMQAVAEPRLGILGLRLLETGYSPRKVIGELMTSDEYPGKRQVGIVDIDGRSAAFTGDANAEWAGHLNGPNYVAMGNLLRGPEVVAAIAEVFLESEGQELEERLVLAIEAGRDAGGQEEGQTSASLLTFGKETFSRCDLRSDISEEPVADLRRLYDWYKPLIPYFLERARNPMLPGFKTHVANLGLERSYGRPVPVTRGPKAGR